VRIDSSSGMGHKTEAKAAEQIEGAELRQLLDEVLAEVDADERAGPLLRAAGLRLRFQFTDLGLVLNVTTTEEPGHHLRWRFSDQVDWEPKLELRMDSAVANAYLQGRESLAIAIARGRVKAKGDSRHALLYVPALRLIVEPYRRRVHDTAPHLALQ
jgi:hypothetical protein